MDANKAAIVTRSKQISTEYAVKHLEEFIAASTTADGASSKGVSVPADIGWGTALHPALTFTGPCAHWDGHCPPAAPCGAVIEAGAGSRGAVA